MAAEIGGIEVILGAGFIFDVFFARKCTEMHHLDTPVLEKSLIPHVKSMNLAPNHDFLRKISPQIN